MSLANDLKQFTGTEHWYRHPLSSMLYTDGVKYFAETAGAYWFVDMMAFMVYPISLKQGFVSITLTVSDSKALIDVTDGNGTLLWSEKLNYTDCADGTYHFYLSDSVLLLRSEY